MSNDLSDIIRTLARETHGVDREKHRNDFYNKSRIIGNSDFPLEKTLSANDVKKMVKEIKQTSDGKESTLSALKIAFIQDRLNMVEFLRIEGALHALVRNLMSHNPQVQLLAAECCCNLSLGDSKTCYQLAKAATPYLVSILQGLNYTLMNYSLLTLGNLCATSKKAVRLIQSQGALQAFQQTIAIPELRESTAFALIMFTKSSLFNESADLVAITIAVLPFLEVSLNIQWLLYHLTTIENTKAILIEQNITVRMLIHLDSFGLVDQDSIQSITSLVRALANLCSESTGSVALTIFNHWDIVFNMVQRLLMSNYQHLHSELAWLFGNLVQHPSPAVQEMVSLKEEDLSWLGNAFSP